MMSQVDVAIIGAGIVGAACARALAGEGLRVAVYDKDTIGGGTTGTAIVKNGEIIASRDDATGGRHLDVSFNHFLNFFGVLPGPG